MSEQYKQDASSPSQEIEDDPLAELARIVAGEPELSPAPQSSVAEEAATSDTSMEAAIEEQLMREFSIDDATVASDQLGEPTAEVEAPAFIDDINSSIEQINNAEPDVAEIQPHSLEQASEVITEEFSAPETTAPVDIAPTAEVANEVGFQDGLIDALEMEIGSAPELEPAPSTEYVEPEQVFEPQFETPETIEQAEAYEVAEVDVETQVSTMQETLEQELTDQFDTFEPAAQEAEFIASESIAEETFTEEPIEEQVSHVIDEPIASIEDDLGAAFASEFEQIAAQSPEQTDDAFPVEEPISYESSEPVLEEPVQVIEQPIQSDSNIEMDFEAAFAEELEVAAVPETPGWSESETADANAAFTAAVSPEAVNYDQTYDEANLDAMENDPGHVGSVDEISAVDAGVVGANDNGGGMKYAIAALVIALFAGAIAAGYGFLGGDTTTVASGTQEIIKADVDPVKVKPKDPGGIVPENQDNASYVDIGGENSAQVSQETLNSQTEEPLVLNTGNSEAPKSDDRLASSEDTGATPNAASNSSVLPKVVQTVVVKPDGTIITKPIAVPTPEAPKPVETALNTVKIGEGSNVAVKPVSTQVIKKPEAIDGAKTTGDITVPVASPLPKPVVKAKPEPVKKVAAAPKPKKAAPAPARKSEWVVQVSSQRTPEAAQSSFSTMRNRYSVLQGRAMSIQRANVNGTTYYRVRVQTASRDDANQLCTSLATAGGSCFVTR